MSIYTVRVEHGKRLPDAKIPEHGPVTPAYLQHPSEVSHVKVTVDPTGKTDWQMDQEALHAAHDIAHTTKGRHGDQSMVTKTEIIHLEAAKAQPRFVHFRLPEDPYEAHLLLTEMATRHTAAPVNPPETSDYDRNRLHDLVARGGFTSHPWRDAPSHGFMASLDSSVAPGSVHHVSELTPEHIASHRASIRQHLLQPHTFQGGWHDTATGDVYLDTSRHFQSEHNARRFAAEHKQKAYYNLGSGHEMFMNPHQDPQKHDDHEGWKTKYAHVGTDPHPAYNDYANLYEPGARTASRTGVPPERPGGPGFMHADPDCPVCFGSRSPVIAAPPPAPLPNPEGGLHWFHGTHFDPDEDEGKSEAEHRGHAHVGPDPGGYLNPPDAQEHEYGGRSHAHWNTDLGLHFTSLPHVAESFANGKGGAWGTTPTRNSRVAHSFLHIANPKHYEDESDMAHHAISLAHKAGYHYMHPDDDDAHSRFIHGNDPSDHDLDHEDDPESPGSRLHAARMNLGTGDRATLSEIDKHGPSGHELRATDAYLRYHPERSEIMQHFQQHLAKQGHDGITYGNSYEGPHGHACAIAFHPHQVNVRKWKWLHPDHPSHESNTTDLHYEQGVQHLPHAKTAAGERWPWFATASDEEIDAHHYGDEIRKSFGEHTSPKGTKYRLVDHGSSKFVSAHVMPSGRAAGTLSWFGGKHDPEKPETTKGVIYKVFVSGPHRRKGLASAMLAHARSQHPEDDIEHSTALSDDGRSWAEKVGSVTAHYDKSWRPHERIFGPTKGKEDPRLFSSDHQMLPEVRQHLLAKLTGFMDKHGWHDWPEWARMYLAGSEASDWYGNNDFDVLVGVDYNAFREVTGSTLHNEEITDALNKAFRADWNGTLWFVVRKGPWLHDPDLNLESYNNSLVVTLRGAPPPTSQKTSASGSLQSVVTSSKPGFPESHDGAVEPWNFGASGTAHSAAKSDPSPRADVNRVVPPTCGTTTSNAPWESRRPSTTSASTSRMVDAQSVSAQESLSPSTMTTPVAQAGSRVASASGDFSVLAAIEPSVSSETPTLDEQPDTSPPPTPEGYVAIGPFNATGYVNPNSYDIRKIKPYAAYDVGADTWAVKPVQVPDDWGPDKFPESTWRIAEQYADEIDRISTLKPASVQKQYARRLFDHIHTDRQRAFSDSGTGVFDVGNVAEKYLDQRPDHPLALLVEMAKQGTGTTKEAAAHPMTQQDWYHGGVIDGGRTLHRKDRYHPGNWLHVGTKAAALERIDPDNWDEGDRSPSGGTTDWVKRARLHRVRLVPGATVCPKIHSDHDDAGSLDFTGAECGDYDAHPYRNDAEDSGKISLAVRPHKVRVVEDLGRHPAWKNEGVTQKWGSAPAEATYHYRHVLAQPKFGEHRYGDAMEPPTQEAVHTSPDRGKSWGSHVFEHQYLHHGVPVAKLRYAMHPDEPNVIEIKGLAVHPDHQRSGLAVHMINKMQDHARAIGGVIDHGTYTDEGHAFSRRYMASDHYDPSLHLPYPEHPTATKGHEFLPHMLDEHEMAKGRKLAHGHGGWIQYYDNIAPGWENDDHSEQTTTHFAVGDVQP